MVLLFTNLIQYMWKEINIVKEKSIRLKLKNILGPFELIFLIMRVKNKI